MGKIEGARMWLCKKWDLIPTEEHDREVDRLQRQWEVERSMASDTIVKLDDMLAAKTLELESLKNKIVQRAQTPDTIKAKTAAEIRRMVEQNNEREFEEQANGI
jgi:hypothetical protein